MNSTAKGEKIETFLLQPLYPLPLPYPTPLGLKFATRMQMKIINYSRERWPQIIEECPFTAKVNSSSANNYCFLHKICTLLAKIREQSTKCLETIALHQNQNDVDYKVKVVNFIDIRGLGAKRR